MRKFIILFLLCFPIQSFAQVFKCMATYLTNSEMGGYCENNKIGCNLVSSLDTKEITQTDCKEFSNIYKPQFKDYEYAELISLDCKKVNKQYVCKHIR